MYVFFKNNCPMNGSLYDDIRICDIESGDVLFNICPKIGYNNDDKDKAALYTKVEEFKHPIVLGSMIDIINWFNN